MIALVFGMLVCLLGGMAVMGFVAVQARRDGRDVLTARGEEVVGLVRSHTESAKDRTNELVSATRDRVTHAGSDPADSSDSSDFADSSGADSRPA